MTDAEVKYSIEVVFKPGRINPYYTKRLGAMLESKYGIDFENDCKVVSKFRFGRLIDEIYLPDTFDQSLTDHGADQRQLEFDIATLDSDPIESATVFPEYVMHCLK